MKVLTIKQPWATLIANGEKTVENRGWRTNHRGPLAIHAGQGWDRDAETLGYRREDFPERGILAVVELLDMVSVDEALLARPEQERFIEGEFCWLLGSVSRLKTTIQSVGKLGFWNAEF